MEECIYWMDDRDENAETLLFRSGIYLDDGLQLIKELNGKPKGRICQTIIYPNIDNTYNWNDLLESSLMNISYLSPNNVFFPLNFENLRKVFKPLSPTMLKLYGFTSDQLVQVLFLNAFRIQKIFRLDPRLALQLIQRGYIPTLPLYKLAEDLSTLWEHYPNIFDEFDEGATESRQKQTTLNVLQAFSYRTDKRNQIDLSERKGLPLFINVSEDFNFLDFRNFLPALDEFIFDCILKGAEKVGNSARNIFPRLAFETISMRQKSISKLWDFNKEFRSRGETKAEIDISFYIEDILFICECKARRQGKDKVIGKNRAIDYIWSDCEKDFEQVKKHIQFLVNNRNTMKDINKYGIKFIVPLIIYPYITWIKKKRTPFCIGPNIPRFMTPCELQKYISNNLDIFRNDPETIKINMNS